MPRQNTQTFDRGSVSSITGWLLAIPGVMELPDCDRMVAQVITPKRALWPDRKFDISLLIIGYTTEQLHLPIRAELLQHQHVASQRRDRRSAQCSQCHQAFRGCCHRLPHSGNWAGRQLFGMFPNTIWSGLTDLVLVADEHLADSDIRFDWLACEPRFQQRRYA